MSARYEHLRHEERYQIGSVGNAFMADVYDGNGAYDAEANAKLIAAAPELLGAIHDLLDAISDLGDDAREEFRESAVTRAIAVVSKAEGGAE